MVFRLPMRNMVAPALPCQLWLQCNRAGQQTHGATHKALQCRIILAIRAHKPHKATGTITPFLTEKSRERGGRTGKETALFAGGYPATCRTAMKPEKEGLTT